MSNNFIIYMPEELVKSYSVDIGGVCAGLANPSSIQLEINKLEDAILDCLEKGSEDVINIGPAYVELQAAYTARTGRLPVLNPTCIGLVSDCQIQISIAKLLAKSSGFRTLFVKSVIQRLTASEKEVVLKCIRSNSVNNNLN